MNNQERIKKLLLEKEKRKEEERERDERFNRFLEDSRAILGLGPRATFEDISSEMSEAGDMLNNIEISYPLAQKKGSEYLN